MQPQRHRKASLAAPLHLIRSPRRSSAARPPANHANVCLCSLRQRGGERGHVRPRQPSERGHPAQLHQHLQRRGLLLHGPRGLRSLHRWTQPERGGEAASEEHGPGAAARQLMVLQQGGVMLPGGRKGLAASVWSPSSSFVLDESVASENNFSAIHEDKRTGTLGVGRKMLSYALCAVFMWCFAFKPSA